MYMFNHNSPSTAQINDVLRRWLERQSVGIGVLIERETFQKFKEQRNFQLPLMPLKIFHKPKVLERRRICQVFVQLSPPLPLQQAKQFQARRSWDTM